MFEKEINLGFIHYIKVDIIYIFDENIESKW